MSSLLEKLRLRPSSTRAAAAKSQPGSDQRRHDDKVRFWVMMVVGVVVVAAAFFWMTSARILGEPVVFNYSPRDVIFAETIGPLLGAEVIGRNSVETLVNGDAFFPAMLKSIREAKKTITFETYIWSTGKISEQFIEAFSERARNGVKVHVIVDGMGTLKFKSEDRKRMIDAGVEFYTYGREHWYELKPNINHRTHRKLLIVDGQIGYTGGMCVDDKWLGNADAPDLWRETVVRVEGPAVRQMQSVFAANWLQTTSRLIVGPDYFPTEKSAGSVKLQCFKSGPNEDPENARISYLLAIAAAQKSIKIAHAYFVPDDLAIKMLLSARQRGVDIEVVIPAINDSRFGRAASRSRWGKLLEAGVKFYRYEPAMYHAKVMLVDDAFVTIGSVNFDNRSFSINDEVNVNVLDADVAAQHVKIFEADRKDSKPLTLEEFNGRPAYQKLLDHLAGMFRSQL
ncbi:MAG: cardiolipin synthase [Opitutaceae bacterium]